MSSLHAQTSRNCPVAKTRPAVLHLVPALEQDEVAREALALAILTQRHGGRALIGSAGGARVREAERNAVRHTTIPFDTQGVWGRWRCRQALSALMGRERPDLLHLHDLTLLPYACRLAARHGVPLLIELRDYVAPTPRLLKLLQVAQKLQARFRVPSACMVRHATEELGVRGDLLYRVYPGLDLNQFDPARMTPERLQRLSQQWRLPEQALVVLMATPWAEGYGHAPFLEALAQSPRKDVFAILVGNGPVGKPARAAIEKSVTTHGLEGRVLMPEHCPDWPAACWLASLIVAVNDKPRGQAPELLAAQAMGRPVLVTTCGANPELTLAGETAWAVPAGDASALAQALQDAITLTADQRILLAQRTRAFVADYFPQDVWATSYGEIYAAMLGLEMEAAA